VSKITAITTGRSREKKLKITMEDGPTLSLLADVALQQGLTVGQELSASQVQQLAADDRRQRCYNAAVRFLGYRPRSQAEIRQRLARHGYDSQSIDSTLARLKRQGLVDDAAFARFWKESRQSFSPRSRRLTGLELRRKGLDNHTIESVLGDVDDAEAAYRAAQGKARRMSATDYDEFRRRLGDYLRRRGFDYDVINKTVMRVWEERGAAGS
jgi:regulatory protein